MILSIYIVEGRSWKLLGVTRYEEYTYNKEQSDAYGKELKPASGDRCRKV